MRKNLLKPAILAALVTLMGVPAAAQVDVNVPGLEIRVGHRAPPPLRRERLLPRPGPDYVWVPGAWDWQGSDWVWVGGRWDRPHGHARWVRARYRREADAYRYEPGHWSDQRLAEGEDYRRWREERRHHRDHDRDDRDHDNDRR